MKCTNCGAELTGAAKFCTACGTPATPAEAKAAETAPAATAPVAERTPESPPNRERKAPVWMVLLFVFLLVATAATVVYAWRAFRYEPSSPVASVVESELEREVAPESEAEKAGAVSQAEALPPGARVQTPAEESRPVSAVTTKAPRTETRVDPLASAQPEPVVAVPPPLVEPASVVEAQREPAPPKVKEAAAADVPSAASTSNPSAAPPPPKRSKKILLGGSQAYDPPAAPEPKRKPSPKKAAAKASVEKPAPRSGDLYWTGELKKKQVVTINGIDSTSGLPGGDFLPGKPVTVEVYSPAIRVIEEPSEANGWTKLSFECLRSSKGSATINFRWKLR